MRLVPSGIGVELLHNRRWRSVLASIVASAGTVSLCAVVVLSSSSSGSAAVAPLPSVAVGTRVGSTSPCQQVVFIGSEGSGQTASQASGLGPEVYEAWLQYRSKLPTVTMGYFPNPYPAAPADLVSLLGSAAYRKTFAASVDRGVTEAVKFLAARTQCPNEHYVIAGFSQGAMVSHRILQVLEDQTAPGVAANLVSRVDGALLIADGDRRGSAADDTRYGTAPRTGKSYGVSWYTPVQTAISYKYKSSYLQEARVHDVCMAGDRICDFSAQNASGVDIHSNSYSRWGTGKYGQTGVVYVRSAATNIAKATTNWLTATPASSPPPTPTADPNPTSPSTSPVTPSVTPTATPTPSNSWGRWTSIASAIGHSCGIKSDATLWCWGWNGVGQLGSGTLTNSSVPVQVGVGSSWSQVTVSQYTSCAIRTDGSAWCWGAGPRVGLRPLGSDGTGRSVETAVLSPERVGQSLTWRSLTTGEYHTCGVSTDGGAWCWGWNRMGQFGNGTAGYDDWAMTPQPVAGGATWTSLTAGLDYTCGINTDGSAFCWGWNINGQLGDGATEPGPSGVLDARFSPYPVVGAGTWRQLSAGDATTCGVQTDNSLWCWGWPGGGSGDTQSTPVSVSTADAWSQVSASMVNTEYGLGSCAVRLDGSAGCWARDAQRFTSAPTAVTGGASWVSVAASSDHTCGLKPDGTVWCWGSGTAGQLGDGRATDSAEPVLISG